MARTKKNTKTVNPHALILADRSCLARMIQAAIPFASTDESRPHLASVAVGVFGRRAFVTATDGHRIVAMRAKRDDAAIFGFHGGPEAPEYARTKHDPILFPARKLAAALKGLKNPHANVRPHLGTVALFEYDAGTGEELSTRSVIWNREAQFPPFQQVCTPADPVESRAAVDPKYLAAIGDFAARIGAKHVAMTIAGELAPVICTAENDDFVAGIWQMPMRGDTSTARRDPIPAILFDPGPKIAAAAE